MQECVNWIVNLFGRSITFLQSLSIAGFDGLSVFGLVLGLLIVGLIVSFVFRSVR